MSKVKSFIGLDFITIKPYFTALNLCLYAATTCFLSIMAGSVESGVMIGVMYGTIFLGYPFALGEKGNLDALYTTLSLEKKTVVAGRYLFTLAMNSCAIALSLALSAISIKIGSIIAESADYGVISSEALWILITVVAAFIVMQSILLPVYFKLGYTKARFFSMIPFIAMTTGYVAVSALAKDNDIVSRIFNAVSEMNSASLAVIAVIGLLLLVYISYSLSLSFYKKREF